jgi:hypothetical protein
MVCGLGVLGSLISWSPPGSKLVGVSRGCQVSGWGNVPIT